MLEDTLSEAGQALYKHIHNSKLPAKLEKHIYSHFSAWMTQRLDITEQMPVLSKVMERRDGLFAPVPLLAAELKLVTQKLADSIAQLPEYSDLEKTHAAQIVTEAGEKAMRAMRQCTAQHDKSAQGSSII